MIVGTIILEDTMLNFKWFNSEVSQLMEVTVGESHFGAEVTVEVDGDDFAKALVLALSPVAEEGMLPEMAKELYEAAERVMVKVNAEAMNKYNREHPGLRFIP